MTVTSGVQLITRCVTSTVMEELFESNDIRAENCSNKFTHCCASLKLMQLLVVFDTVH
jgi:hypothetical protein